MHGANNIILFYNTLRATELHQILVTVLSYIRAVARSYKGAESSIIKILSLQQPNTNVVA